MCGFHAFKGRVFGNFVVRMGNKTICSYAFTSFFGHSGDGILFFGGFGGYLIRAGYNIRVFTF